MQFVEQAQQILAHGHELGNHLERDVSWYYANLGEAEFARVLDETNEILHDLMDTAQDDKDQAVATTSNNNNKIKWFRAPQGIMSTAMRQVLANHGMTNVMGDCYCDDWAFAEKAQSTTNVVAPLMLRQVQEGSIAIFHMPQRGFRETTLNALDEFLHGLRERNLKCVSVSEMMQKQPLVKE